MKGERCECDSLSFSLRWWRPAVLRVRSSMGRMSLSASSHRVGSAGWREKKSCTRAKCRECKRSKDILMSTPQAHPSHDTVYIISAVLAIFPSGTACNATFDVSCFIRCQEVFLHFPWSRRPVFVGDDPSSLTSYFTNFADPSGMSILLMRNSDAIVPQHGTIPFTYVRS